MYREAKIILTNKIYITNSILADKVAGGGVFVSYENISSKEATVKIKTNIKSEADTEREIQLIQELCDNEGEIVASVKSEEIIRINSDKHYEQVLKIRNPILWGIENPYLYNLKTSICCGKEILDSITTEIGIRDFEFTLENGFILNGEAMRLSGANYHQTYPYVGNAVSYSLLKRDILKLKSAGMKNIRSHYPFCEEFVSFCNKHGMTMIVSNIGWQFCKEGIFFERAMQNMRDIIRWQRNNPCIIIWEPILNESQINYENQEKLHKLVHEEYPYSPCFTASDWGPTDIAYREYDPGMLGKGREKYGLVAPRDAIKRPMWVREYGDFPDNFDDQNSIWRTPRRWGDYAMVQTVERMIGRYDTTEGPYTKAYNNKSICGYGIWPAVEHNRGYHMDDKYKDKNMEFKSVCEDGIEWYDYSDFMLYGVCKERMHGSPFTARIPEKLAEVIEVDPYSAAGVRLRFATNSYRIMIKAKLKNIYSPVIVPLSAYAGFDILEMYQQGNFEFLGLFKPPGDIAEIKEFSSSVNTNSNGEIHDFVINFPLFAAVDDLKIGVSEGSIIKKGNCYCNEGKPIVFYGSSITHGAAASRPGLTFGARISAKYNLDYINLGFAGHAKGEKEMAEYISTLDMGLFVCEYDYNAPSVDYLEKTHYEFYKTIRKGNPNVPYIMISKPDFIFNIEGNSKRREVILKSYEKAIESGDNDVYFIDGGRLVDGEDIKDCFVDGCHPNDAGFARIAEVVAAYITKL